MVNNGCGNDATHAPVGHGCGRLAAYDIIPPTVMRFNRSACELLQHPVPLSRFPTLPCPDCGLDSLRLSPGSVQLARKPHPKNPALVPRFDPEASVWEGLAKAAAFCIDLKYQQHRYVAFLVCDRCGQSVAAQGDATVAKPGTQGQLAVPDEPKLAVNFFTPALQIIPRRNNYPERIKDELARSFATFFCDPAATGNRIRTLVEVLLDEQGIDKLRQRAGRKTEPGRQERIAKIPLGERLKLFEASRPDIARMLMSIKLFGNEASHGSGVSSSDVLDAYELLNHVLEDLYVHAAARAKMAKLSASMGEKF